METQKVFHAVYGIVIHQGWIYLHLVEAKDAQVLTCFGGIKPSGTSEALFLSGKIRYFAPNIPIHLAGNLLRERQLSANSIATVYQVVVENFDATETKILRRIDCGIQIAPPAQRILALLQIDTPSLR